MDRDVPPSVVTLEGRTDRVLGVEAFAETCCEPAGGRFVASEASNGGGRVHNGASLPFAFARAMAI